LKSPPTTNPSHPLEVDAIIQGFKQWPKCTTMSPSGHHLGIYKSLAKHFPPPKDKNAPETAEPPNPIQCGNNILKLLITMMELAVKHTYTYKRWKVIWTLLFVKIFIMVMFSNAMNPREILPVLSLHGDAVPGPYARLHSANLGLPRSGQT